MPSKKRGGLSKREYAAKMAGGTLNYKTGKISVPSKKSTNKSSGSDFSKYQSMDWGSAAEAAKKSGIDISTGSPFDLAMNKRYNPENYARMSGGKVYPSDFIGPIRTQDAYSGETSSQPKTVNTTQRTAAAGAQQSKPTRLGRAIQIFQDPFGLIPKANAMLGTNYQKSDLGMTESLGIETESPVQVFETGDAIPNYLENQPYGGGGQVLGAEAVNPNYINPNATSPYNYPGYTPVDNSRKDRTPTRVTNPTPTYVPPTPSISPTYNQTQPDYTPVNNNQRTTRQFLGNGYLSNGIASNGKGDYGVEGVMTGTSDDENWLNQINPFYTPTANAQELNNMNIQGSSTAEWNNLMNALQQGTASGALEWSGGAPVSYPYANTSPAGEDIPATPDKKAPVQTGGGVAQQFAQGTTGGSQNQFDSSGYKKQMKAQEKALKELIKSIKNEYAQSRTEGTTQLEKAKQQDLMKLSGLYNFGLNQDPNSEDRIHAQERMGSDYAGRLTEFLNKLTQGESKDISGAKINYQSQLADIMAQMQQAQADYENQMWDRQYKLAQANKRGSRTTTPSQKQAAYWSPDGSYTFNEIDPETGLKVFYDPVTNEPFVNG